MIAVAERVAEVADPLCAFDEYLARVGRAKTTRTKYLQTLRGLELQSGTRSMLELSTAEIDELLARWESAASALRGRPPSRATARSRVCALRAYFAWAERFGLLLSTDGQPRPNPMRQIVAPVVPQRPNDRLHAAEDVALLAAPRTPEERFIVWLLRWTGLRVSEATGLRISDVDLTAGSESLHVRSSKTLAGVRIIPVVPELLPEFEMWFEFLRANNRFGASGPLLSTRHRTPMKATYLWRLLKRVAARAGVRVIMCTCGTPSSERHTTMCPRGTSGENQSRVSPHTLRRTFATDLLNRGVRLEVVSKLLGHASVGVTQRAYASLFDSTARHELFRALGHMSEVPEAEEADARP